jgi:hypothetical protein
MSQFSSSIAKMEHKVVIERYRGYLRGPMIARV